MRDGCVIDPAWKCASVDETMNNCDDVLDDLPMYLQDVLYDAAGLCSERGIPHGSRLCHARWPYCLFTRGMVIYGCLLSYHHLLTVVSSL